ncbi:long-chain-fatty-acid--CoA ligase [Blastococcus sp. Marseille-P5729]|uniref:long-chain-fatty-acid--CoA ligase n=1 Tax=Blastococcus sp. Marseille-P5729 TaxID=2086582 RepID=UPI0018FEBE8E|nr:long-chain-fatty-acid--CoA ligase [Blastococcus sp. Marseille-P5729]
MPEPIMTMPSTGLDWVHQLDRHAYMNPDGVALRFRGETTSWAQLADRSRRLASALADAGVERGDRVIIMITNRPEFLEAVIATNVLGAVAVPINFRLVAREVEFLVQDSGSMALVVEQALAPLIATVRESAGEDLAVLVVGDDASAAGDGARSYEDELQRHEPSTEDGPQDEGELALIMYTSGTTGRPKGSMLTYRNIAAQAFTMALVADEMVEEDIKLITPPLFHIAGIANVLPSVLAGSPCVIMPTGLFDPVQILDVLEQERITSVFLVPTQWQAVCAVPGIADRDLRLTSISWGASPATPAILRAMAETFPNAKNICTFGQTEMSPVTTVLPGRDAVRKLGSVGKAVPLVAMRIVDPGMNDVAPGEVGEIVYRGPGTMSGYWNNPEATEDAFRGGWFHSGDLVRMDEEGFLYVVDRVKDMIISGGENIYSSEVENAISEHPKVHEVAVVGAPHEKWVETPVAYVVPRDENDPPSAAEILEFLKDRLASYKKPTRIHLIGELPRNASGKVLKGPLREQSKA